MAIQYVCDICGKAHHLKKTGLTQAGFESPMTVAPHGWGAISVMAPREKPKPDKPAMIEWPRTFLVCSQACAQKALEEAGAYLRQAFEKVGD